MRVWTVANQKGGVGKTTTSVALGGLAADAGHRVLLIDLDPHGSLSAYFRLDPDRLEKSVFNLFDQKNAITPALVSDILVETSYAHIALLPASTALATLERQGIGGGMGLVISKAIQAVKDDYDTVIIDCPPQLGVLMINALAACNELLIPVQTEFLAIKGLERMLHTLNMLSRSRHQELSYLVVPTMFDRRTQASVTSLRAMRNTYGEDVWAGKIPIDTRFRDASKAGIPPHLFDPQGRGVAAYSSLYALLMGKEKVAKAV